MNTKKCLEILQLDCVTSAEELTRAYHKMLQICHSDRVHGHPGLEQQAVVRLKEIEFAYTHLMSYFHPGSSRQQIAAATKLPNSPSKFSDSPYTGYRPGKSTVNFCEITKEDGRRESDRIENFKTYSADTKFPVGRLVLLFLGVLIFGGIGGLIFMAPDWRVKASKPLGSTTEVMENAAHRLTEKTAAPEKKADVVPDDLPPVQPVVSDGIDKPLPAETINYYEIWLKGGTVIITRSYWEVDNMVMYKQYGGKMGVEKSRVDKIVKR